MAASHLRALAGDSIDVHSASSQPGNTVNLAAVTVMAEEGIDLSTVTPLIFTTDAVRQADVVITMGRGDACPIFPGKRYEDWQLTDLAGQPVEVVRAVRDDMI